MWLAIIAGAALLSIIGIVARVIFDPIGSLIALIRLVAFCFALMCWVGWYLIDGPEQSQAMLYAIIGSVVWFATFLVRD